jgi:hypothetical protein
MKRKARTEIPTGVAARVLFQSDRTCCVCRQAGKPVQIHHIDDDPSNNTIKNLSVLCFDCHRETQIRGGFDRKLDADQVILYRDDWHVVVGQRRAAASQMAALSAPSREIALSMSTSVADIYRDNEEYELLAIHFDALGNIELRDKYIELALKKSPSDSSICVLRAMQERPDLIPAGVLKRQLAFYAKHKDYTQRARTLAQAGRHKEAAKDYVRGILDSLEDDNVFSAAFYIKELAEDGVLEELFVLALEAATKENDLWWQVRALQELGWDEELNELLLKHAKSIEAGDNSSLQELLAEAQGNSEQLLEIRKDIAKRERSEGDAIITLPKQARPE